MNHEEKRQAILEGQRMLEAARRDKRVVPSNGTGHRWRASWPVRSGRWAEPSQEELRPAARGAPLPYLRPRLAVRLGWTGQALARDA